MSETAGTSLVEPSLAEAEVITGQEQLPNVEQILSGFESLHYVKDARSISEAAQLGEARHTGFTYLRNARHVTADHIEDRRTTSDASNISESEGIEGFYNSLMDLEDRLNSLAISDQQATAIVNDMLEEKLPDGSLLPGTTEMDRPDEGKNNIKLWLRKKIEALQQTSYLGEEELAEASLGLALYWKSYLDADPDNQLLIPEVEGTKSSGYVLERILENFDEEELEVLNGRIVNKASDLTAPPEKSKIVLLDDWLMSGDQLYLRLNSAHRSLDVDQAGGFGNSEWLTEDIDFEAELGGDGYEPVHTMTSSATQFDREVEINTLIADQRRIDKGFTYAPAYVGLPVKAYFRAPDALDAQDNRQNADDSRWNDRYFSRITGLHSSADHNFSITVNNVVNILDRLEQHQNPSAVQASSPEMPPLTNIVRAYRTPHTPRTDRLFDTPAA